MTNKMGQLGAFVGGFLLIWLGSTNVFNLVPLGEIGSGIVVAAGVITLSSALVSFVPSLPKPLSGALIVGLLTIIVGLTGLFGLLDAMGYQSTPTTQGIILGLGTLTLVGGLLSGLGLGKIKLLEN